MVPIEPPYQQPTTCTAVVQIHPVQCQYDVGHY